MNNTFLIAEIGQAMMVALHTSLIYNSVSKTGVNSIKFQTHIAEAESSEFEKFRLILVMKTSQDLTIGIECLSLMSSGSI